MHTSKTKRIVYLNGKYVEEQKAKLSLFDTAISTGEKVVEVTRTFNQKPHEIDAHMHRLFDGLKRLDLNIPITKNQMKELIAKTLKVNIQKTKNNGEWQIVIYISRGPAAHFELISKKDLKPTIAIQCFPLEKRLAKMAYKYVEGVELVVVDQIAIPNSVVSPQLKSNGRIDHIMGRLQAKRISHNASGVLLDQKGYITESTGASLFFIKNKTLYTAQPNQVLSGVTQSLIFKIAKKLNIKVVQKKLTVQDAISADEAFVTSTVICLLHAKSFNKKKYNNGHIGPITEKIRNQFMAEVKFNFITNKSLKGLST